MKQYTLSELKQILSDKYFLPKDRFIHYFVNYYGYSERESSEMFQEFIKFPRNLINNQVDEARIDEIMQKALKVIELFKFIPITPYQFNDTNERNKTFTNKVLYVENNVRKEVVINFKNTMDILLFSEIISRKVEIVSMLNYCCEVSQKDESNSYSPNLTVFQGDIFDTHDKFYGTKSNIYVAQENGVFKKLLYIKGLGYIHNNKLNYEDDSYNSYALTFNSFSKIGNIYEDISFLSDEAIQQLISAE